MQFHFKANLQVCISGDPFTTPKTSTLMEQYRKAESQTATNSGLSRLLAKREEAMTEARGSRGEGEGRGLKNSRQFFPEHTSLRGSCDGEGEGEREGQVSGDVCDPTEGTRAVATASSEATSVEHLDAVWRELVHTMKMARVEGVLQSNIMYIGEIPSCNKPTGLQHINHIDIKNSLLMDFDPQMTEFTMKRK